MNINSKKNKFTAKLTVIYKKESSKVKQVRLTLPESYNRFINKPLDMNFSDGQLTFTKSKKNSSESIKTSVKYSGKQLFMDTYTLLKINATFVDVYMSDDENKIIIKRAKNEAKLIEQARERIKKSETGYFSNPFLIVNSKTQKELCSGLPATQSPRNFICRMKLGEKPYLDIWNEPNMKKYLSIPRWVDLKNEQIGQLDSVTEFIFRISRYAATQYYLPIDFLRINKLKNHQKLPTEVRNGHLYVDIKYIYCSVCGKQMKYSTEDSYKYFGTSLTEKDIAFIDKIGNGDISLAKGKIIELQLALETLNNTINNGVVEKRR